MPALHPAHPWSYFRVLVSFACLAASTLAAPPASAHQVGMSTGEYAVSGPSVAVRLKLSPEEVVLVAPEVDADKDGDLDASDLPSARLALIGATLGKLSLAQAEGPCPLEPGAVRFDDQDGVVLDGTARCPAEGRVVEVSAGYLAAFPPGHRHFARVDLAGESQEFLARAAEPAFRFEAGRSDPLATAGRFVVLGLEHIFTGFDHLLFLLGLLLLGGTAWQLAGIVTSFTVAHSITLALATLGVVAPDPSLVEPAIALSIVYVAIENIWLKEVRGRWRLTFAFGLVHGFGFAGVLKELDLPRADLAASLVSFNVGVELGQVAVVAAALPLLLALRRRAWFVTSGVRALSLGIATLGAAWFVERVFGA